MTKNGPEPKSKLERLAIASAVAPGQRDPVARRRVKVVDGEGNVLREVDDTELVRRLRLREGIELSTFPSWQRCAICNRPATRNSQHNARNKGTRAYCKAHHGGKRPIPRCSFRGCIKPRKTPHGRYCEAHYHGRKRPKTLTGLCGVCGAATLVGRTYCPDHKTAGAAKLLCELFPCAFDGCNEPATRSSTKSARCHGRKAFCAKHKGGRIQPNAPGE